MCDCGYIVIIMRYGTSMEGVSSGSMQKLDSGLDWTMDWTLDWTLDSL